MVERNGHEFPHPHFGGWTREGKAIETPHFLPDYITIAWTKDDKQYEAQINPDRALNFLLGQEEILGNIDDWWIM